MIRSRSAFSLIEVLVVISIIAMLMAVSVTYLSSAKARARGIECQKNLGDWAKGLSMCIDDSRIHAFPGVGSVSGARDDKKAWFNVIPKALDTRPLSDYAAEEKLPGPSSGIKSLYVCPLASKSSNPDDIFCYAANRNFQENGDSNGSFLRAAKVKNSDAFIVFMDSPGPGICSADAGLVLGAGTDSFRHGGRMNAAFLDGSVRSLEKRHIIAGADNPKKINNANILWDPIPEQ